MAQFERGWWRPAAVISSAAFVAVLSSAPVNALADEVSATDDTPKAAVEQVVLNDQVAPTSVTGEVKAKVEPGVSGSEGSAPAQSAVSAAPKTDEGPSSVPSTNEEPKADSPKTEESKAEEPKVEEAAPELPRAEDSIIDEDSKTDSPTEVKADSNKTIADGTYAIGSSKKVTQVLDAQDGGRTNETNVQLFESNMTASQKWDVKYHENDGGYYTIGLSGTNLVLDVQWGVAKNGSNVWLYESNGTKAQRWNIVKTTEGLWSVLSQLGNYCLDVEWGNTVNGTNLQLFQSNGTKSQMFQFLQYNPAAPEGNNRPIENGIYIVGSGKTGGSKVLDIDNGSMENSGNVQLFQGNGTAAQRYYFEYDGEGYYTITNLGSGKVLDLNNAGIMPGTNVQQFTSNSTSAQKWAVRYIDGVYYLVNKGTGLALDAEWGGTANGTNIWGYTFDKSIGQQWLLTKDAGFIKTDSDGTAIVSIAAFNNIGRVFDIKNGSSSNGGALQLWNSNDSIAQRFEIHSLGNDEYRIRTGASGGWLTVQNGKIVQMGNSKTNASVSDTWKAVWTGGYFSLVNANGLALDLSNGSIDAGTLVQAFASNGTAAQHFFFRAADLIKEGYYTIASALGGNKTLDVANGALANGSNVQIYSSNDTNAQKFKITKSGNYYVVTSGSSSYALDAQNGGTSNGTNVQIYATNGTPAQSWSLKIADGGGVVFINTKSGRALDVAGDKASDGANVQLYDIDGSRGQTWKLTSTTISDGWTKVGNTWYFGGNAYTASCHSAWEKIKDLSGAARASSYGVQPYIITIDNTACRVQVFQGKQGDWRPIYDWAAGVGDANTYDHGTFLTNDPNIGGKGFDMFIGNNWDGTQIHNPSIPSDGLVAFTSFFGAQGFHSTCGNHSDPSQTGKHISHGCVRLLESNAWWIYNNAPLGTLVYSF